MDSFGGGIVMMWSTIPNDRTIDLVHVPCNLTPVRYRDEILQLHLIHVIDQHRELFQHTMLGQEQHQCAYMAFQIAGLESH